MDVTIRKEERGDYPSVFNLIEEAFRTEEQSDHREHFLVERLRNSGSFLEELSLVALHNERVIGHLLLTKIKINNENNSFDSLALAPVSVLPAYQKMGIGSKLILEGHRRAKELGFGSVVLLGHKDYYPRFGYQWCEMFGIELPFDVPADYCMAIELTPHSLKEVNGMVEYDGAFSE